MRILQQAESGGARVRRDTLRDASSGSGEACTMTRLLLALSRFYSRWLSPALHSLSPGGCKFIPTCSEYAADAIATHGPLRGSALAAWRLLRCHPFTPRRIRSGPPPRAPRLSGPNSPSAIAPEPFPPRTVTIERAAPRGCPFSHDRKYPLPEIQNPNLQSQGSGGGGGDMRSTMTSCFLS